MLRHRLIFGSIMIVILGTLFWLDNAVEGSMIPSTSIPTPPGSILFLIFVALVYLGAAELHAVFKALDVQSTKWITQVASAATLISFFAVIHFPSLSTDTLAATLVAGFWLTLLWHVRNAEVKGAVLAGGATVISMTYLGLMSGFLLAIRHDHSTWMVLAVIIVTKCCDIGAYFTGRALGKHKMIPWLSPKKTWEGLAGGVLFSSIVAAAFAWSQGDSSTSIPIALAAVFGAILAVVGQAGDLTMSLFKRDAGVKDSGSVIPGFGGVMDVVDSPLLVAPVAYWLLRLV